MELQEVERHFPTFWNVIFSIVSFKMSIINFLIKTLTRDMTTMVVIIKSDKGIPKYRIHY